MVVLSHGTDLLSAVDAVWDAEQDEFRAALKLDAWERGILYLDRMEIKPEYRGLGRSLEVARAIIRPLGRGCAVCVIFPMPLNHHDLTKTATRAGQRRLQQHWAKLGFRKVPRHPEHFYLDLARVLPWELPENAHDGDTG